MGEWAVHDNLVTAEQKLKLLTQTVSVVVAEGEPAVGVAAATHTVVDFCGHSEGTQPTPVPTILQPATSGAGVAPVQGGIQAVHVAVLYRGSLRLVDLNNTHGHCICIIDPICNDH